MSEDGDIMVLNQIDIDMLRRVYDMRTLTVKQIYNLYYKNDYSLEEFITIKLKELEKEGYIKTIFFAGNYAVLIDNKGYELLKDIHLVKEIVDADSSKNKKGYNTQKENNLNQKAINHQVHLNEFVLQYEENLKKLPIDIKSSYFDEKNVSKYIYMRPDGLVSTIYGFNKIDFFLEMDMATESAKQLEEKWARYNTFVNSKQFYGNEERIVVLFILANTEKLEERRRLVLRTILNKFNGFNPRLEIYVGTKDYLLNLMFDLIINKPNGKFYVRESLQSKDCKNVSIANVEVARNKIFNYVDREKCSLLYDDYTKESISVLDKIQNISLYLRTIGEKSGKKTYYLVFMKNDKEAIDKLFADIKFLDLTFQLDNLIFTTKERLDSMPFCEACFLVLRDGSIRHFKDEDFVETDFERAIGIFED